MNFITDPGAIEKKSMEIIRGLLGDLGLGEVEEKIVHRVVHTAGDPEIAPLIQISSEAVSAGLESLKNGCNIITDVRMLTAGINSRVLSRLGCKVFCAMQAAETDLPPKGITRAMWGMEKLKGQMDGAVIAIGNAPTALIKLLELVKTGQAAPALVIGTPVGFVGARESKEILMASSLPYLTVSGNRGGSTIAASMLNALLYAI